MKIKITRQKFFELPKRDQDNLYSNFTIKHLLGSLMQKSIKEMPRTLDTFVARGRFGRIVAWAAVREFQGKTLLMIFVDPKHRRNGYATELFHTAKKEYENIYMKPWDLASFQMIQGFQREFQLGVIR